MNIIKRNKTIESFNVEKIKKVINFACKDLNVDPLDLEMSIKLQITDGLSTKGIQKTLIQTASEKIIQTSSYNNAEYKEIYPDWQYVAARLLYYDLYKEAAITRKYEHFGYGDFLSLINHGVKNGMYSSKLKENFTDDEIVELGNYISSERDNLFNYDGLNLLFKRYLIKEFDGSVFELPQERFMITAMWLSQNESKDKKMKICKEYYDLISNLKASLATPILSNSGKPIAQLSSCFVSCVDDNLWSIYDTDSKFSEISKWGGALGIYLGKIRSMNSSIRNYKGVSGGVIPWVKNYNNTAVAVDQLGTRKGSCTVTLDIWHNDIFEFLNIRTNNGDDRRKAHDVFSSISIPNLFMKRLKKRENWTLFDPHEIRQVMRYSLEDFYDDEYLGQYNFTEKYLECENSDKLTHKTTVKCIDIMKQLLTSSIETGNPFIFFRDTSNALNPMKNRGIVYSSNLCQEIIQNISPSEFIESKINEDGTKTDTVKMGTMATCNLSSITLGRVDMNNLEEQIRTQVRLLDSTIDINNLPVTEAINTNNKYRAIGIGVSDYHHLLVKNNIRWESEEHFKFIDKLFEDINYYAIKASMELAKEKGRFEYFEGSEWDTGLYFERRGYTSERWIKLKNDVKKYGIRNSYILAVAPTGSTSNIVGSTAGIDPIYKKFFTEEKKGMLNIKTCPNIDKYFWRYKEAHTIDQSYSIKACGIRQKHIDQSQSFNIYINHEMSALDILNLYIECWENNLKTVYYIRNLSLETEECTSCSS